MLTRRTSFSWKQNLVLSVLLVAFVSVGFLMSCEDATDTDPVLESKRDGKGVWFIEGPADSTLYTIYEAMGYNVAQDRLWQAETYRRSARGTLSAVLGSAFLEQDTLARITGYSESELDDGYNALSSEVRTIVDAYCAGFNRRIAEISAGRAALPFEFGAVGFTPDPWTSRDVLAWVALMQRNFDPEALRQGQVDNAALLQHLGANFPSTYLAMFEDLRWINDPAAQTYIPGGDATTNYPSLIGQDLEFADLRPLAEKMNGMRNRIHDVLASIDADIKMGSYAWAISGSKTQSGNPIIYSGPQMGFTVPSIVLEGSICAGDLQISGMSVAGIPGIIIGRTPHHAWSMQVGHAHTVDYYIESPENVTLHRLETISVRGQDDVTIPVYRSSHGPIVNPVPYNPETYTPDPSNPILAWKYAHWGYEFAALESFLGLARAQSMDEFGAAIEKVAVSQHFCYADNAGNIAYWMSGRDPVRETGEYRFPQGFLFPALEWDASQLITRSHDRNTSQNYYCGWNNKSSASYKNSPNNPSYFFGPFHRAHVVDDYLSTHDNLTYENVRDLALNIATTDSFGSGGNPWAIVGDIFAAAVEANSTADRTAAVELINAWDGHFVAGGEAQWATGALRADAWVLMDQWIREAIRLTFEDELGSMYSSQSKGVLFNTMIHGALGADSSIVNYYNWFTNIGDPTAPQTLNDIIVTALDNVMAQLGPQPWDEARGVISYTHDVLGVTIWTTPFASRSTYAHCVEMGSAGPLRIESMFPLGEYGHIGTDSEGMPDFWAMFFAMTPEYDSFTHRVFPLFE